MGGSRVEVVNIAAVGDLETEVDIQQIVHDSDLPVSNYDPEYNAIFLLFEEDVHCSSLQVARWWWQVGKREKRIRVRSTT
jgi:TATA-box binding protein (TBP) (component of TFIID and TFIIIB)